MTYNSHRAAILFNIRNAILVNIFMFYGFTVLNLLYCPLYFPVLKAIIYNPVYFLPSTSAPV